MYFTIYRTTNILDNKFYIGMHKTKNIEDNYLGSGKYLKRAIYTHGVENFEKEILFIFDNPEEMYQKEIELVTEDLIKNPMCYNLTVGGWGGNRIVDPSHHIHSDEHIAKMNSARLRKSDTDKAFRERWSKSISVGMLKSHASGTAHVIDYKCTGHSEATKQKISQSNKGKKVGVKNSQFGTIWITDGLINKKINSVTTIPDGWYRGRVLNK